MKGTSNVERRVFRGAGLNLVADIAGDEAGPPLLFVHGGGQTRSSWKGAVKAAADRGYLAVTLDQRGHGESDWAPDGDYSLDAFAADIRAVAAALPSPPAVVGASLGGLAALLVAGEGGADVPGLVLVDVVPRIEEEGGQEIGAFMTSAPDGFASLDDAADAVAAYLPHRPRPENTGGLLRNLRLKEDGRYHWHWDPAFMNPARHGDPETRYRRLEKAGAAICVPTLILRGGLSRVVSKRGARAFAALLQDGELIDVEGADHMVAGDRNDIFNQAVFGFLSRRIFPALSVID